MRLLQPDYVHLCDGSETEANLLLQQMVQSGMIIPLNPNKRPNSFLARSTASDGALFFFFVLRKKSKIIINR